MLQPRGDYFYGQSDADIAEYLRFAWPYDLPHVELVEHSGGRDFMIWIDVAAGAAAVQRKEPGADDLVFLVDSQSRWNAPAAQRVVCSCGSDLHQVAVAYQNGPTGDPVWVLVGTRCIECGLLASPLDWNLG